MGGEIPDGCDVTWGAPMAAAVIITLPVLTIGVLAQRYVIAGLTAGGVKV